MDRHNILDFPLNPTLTIVRLIFRRVIQCESKGVQSAVQRCQGYTVLYLQTCKNLCIVQGTGAGEIRQPAPQSKLRELHPKGSAHCKGPQDHLPVIRYACFVRSCPRKHGISWINSNKIDFCPWNRGLWWTGYKTTGILRWAGLSPVRTCPCWAY